VKRAELSAATPNTWIVPVGGDKTGPWLSFMGVHDDEAEFISQVAAKSGYVTMPVEEVLKDWEVWNP